MPRRICLLLTVPLLMAAAPPPAPCDPVPAGSGRLPIPADRSGQPARRLSLADSVPFHVRPPGRTPDGTPCGTAAPVAHATDIKGVLPDVRDQVLHGLPAPSITSLDPYN